MEASEMLDVLHYLFEEDLLGAHPELAEAKSDIRNMIYQDLYQDTYNYGIKGGGKKYNETEKGFPSDGLYEDLKPFDPLAGPTKPYIPPTDFNGESPLPFGSVLDGPLG